MSAPDRQPLVLAIDFGTSWCKAAYVTPDGSILAIGRVWTRGLPSRGGADGLDELWQALVSSVQDANARLTAAAISARPDAVGIACRGMFGVVLNKHREPLPLTSLLPSSKGSPITRAVYASPAWLPEGGYAYSYAPRLVGSLRWLRDNEPDNWPRVRFAGALHDWLVLQLSGIWVTDLATGPGQDDWPQAMVELTGLPLDTFPVIRNGHALAGTLTTMTAQALDLPAGTPVITGYHDGGAASIGTGTISAGDTCLTLGSNLAFRPVSSARLPDCFGYPITRDAWAWVDSVAGSAARLDDVAATLSGTSHATPEQHQKLAALGLRVPAGSPGDEPGAIYRATVEAIALDVRRLMDRAIENGARPTRLVATGGATDNPLMLNVLSAILGMPIEIGPPEAGILGTAIGAAVASGWLPSIGAGVATMVQTAPGVEPDPEDVAAYEMVRDTL